MNTNPNIFGCLPWVQLPQIGGIPNGLVGLAGPDGQGLIPVLPAGAAHVAGVGAGIDGGRNPREPVALGQIGVALK